MDNKSKSTNSTSTSLLVGTPEEMEAITKSQASGHTHVYYTGCASLPTSQITPTSSSEASCLPSGSEQSQGSMQKEASTTLGDFSFLPYPQYCNYNRYCNKLFYLHQLSVNLSN
ncbi:unnamed protein product [Phytomonas sp. Hart1]|nr:unnamed protein product [Phytomonas sp. Hart1]|eukprot:CCW68661.1 unnamed protein product [Phytomonas sp. isolate Hart1]